MNPHYVYLGEYMCIYTKCLMPPMSVKWFRKVLKGFVWPSPMTTEGIGIPENLKYVWRTSRISCQHGVHFKGFSRGLKRGDLQPCIMVSKMIQNMQVMYIDLIWWPMGPCPLGTFHSINRFVVVTLFENINALRFDHFYFLPLSSFWISFPDNSVEFYIGVMKYNRPNVIAGFYHNFQVGRHDIYR